MMGLAVAARSRGPFWDWCHIVELKSYPISKNELLNRMLYKNVQVSTGLVCILAFQCDKSHS